MLFHHDPGHTDDLEVLLARAVDLWGEAPNPPVLADEGMELVLDAEPAAVAEEQGGPY